MHAIHMACVLFHCSVDRNLQPSAIPRLVPRPKRGGGYAHQLRSRANWQLGRVSQTISEPIDMDYYTPPLPPIPSQSLNAAPQLIKKHNGHAPTNQRFEAVPTDPPMKLVQPTGGVARRRQQANLSQDSPLSDRRAQGAVSVNIHGHSRGE